MARWRHEWDDVTTVLNFENGRRWKRHISQICKVNIQSNRNGEGNGTGYEIFDTLIGDSATDEEITTPDNLIVKTVQTRPRCERRMPQRFGDYEVDL